MTVALRAEAGGVGDAGPHTVAVARKNPASPLGRICSKILQGLHRKFDTQFIKSEIRSKCGNPNIPSPK